MRKTSPRSLRRFTPLLVLLVAATFGALPGYAAIEDCDVHGGLEQMVYDSYRIYSKSQFDSANQGLFADFEIILDSLEGLETIPAELPSDLTDAAQRLKMGICRDGADLIHIYPNAGSKSDRPPVSLTWRVGGVVVPGDPATSAEPVDPLFIQAPHFREAEPVAVRLMRETKAKVMLFAVNRHSGSDYPRYMNAARPGSHIFITLMDDLNDRFPLAAGIVLHGMRRRGDQPNPTSGMIQPGDNKDMMRVRERFNVPSFNDMLARGFGLALESVPADFPGIEVDPRLQEEMRAPNGSSFGLGDMENFFWAVNTSKIHGYSAEHVKRIQAIHLEMPQTFRYEEISGVHNPYLEGNQRALVRAVNTAMEEYKQSSAFGTTAEPDYCQTTCRIHYYQGLGVRIFDRADFEGKEWILPIGGEDGQLYDARNIDDVDSILFPEGWSGEITFYENADGTGASVTFNSSDSNPTESAFASSAASVSVGQPLFFEPGLPVTVEAEDYNSKSGGLKVETKSGGITNLGRIGTGDWAKYENVDLTGKNTFTAQIASRNDTSSGTITVHIDDRDTVPVAVLKDAPGPGGWSSFGPASAPLNREVYGAHDVYLVFGSGYNLDAFTFAFQTVSSADHVEAEQYTEAQGRISIEVKSTGVTCLGRIGTGDWVRYAGIDFGDGADTLNARIATRSATSSGAISVHLGSLDNPPVAILMDVSGPGGWENFAPASVPLSEVVTGVHDVYLKFESGYNLDSFGFVSQ